jgi:beta-alanine degradation protein BauB
MNRRALLLVPVLLLLLSAAAAAADAVVVAPGHFKVLLENDEVRVLEYTARAGDKVGMHSHPPHVVISRSTGTTRFTNADGSNRVQEIKEGELRWSDAVTHAQEAITDGHVIVIELKKKSAK